MYASNKYIKNPHVYAHLTKLRVIFLPRKKGYLGYQKGKMYLMSMYLHELLQSVKFRFKNYNSYIETNMLLDAESVSCVS